MNIITNTYLNDFKLIDKITGITDNKITAYKKIESNEPYLILESFAQLAALHVRYKINYKRHVFLLKIKNFHNNNINNNLYLLNGKILSSSNISFLYELTASNNDSIIAKSKLIISTVNYSKLFKKQLLEKYYRDLVKCLMKE